jgi:hypothetical protein
MISTAARCSLVCRQQQQQQAGRQAEQRLGQLHDLNSSKVFARLWAAAAAAAASNAAVQRPVALMMR